MAQLVVFILSVPLQYLFTLAVGMDVISDPVHGFRVAIINKQYNNNCLRVFLFTRTQKIRMLDTFPETFPSLGYFPNGEISQSCLGRSVRWLACSSCSAWPLSPSQPQRSAPIAIGKMLFGKLSLGKLHLDKFLLPNFSIKIIAKQGKLGKKLRIQIPSF